jgi:putative ABC transport system permease protein
MSPAAPLRPAAFQFVRAVLGRDGRFLAVTLSSCAVAAVVAMFQYSVYTSFLRASAVVPRMLGGDFWVTSATVQSFDFPNHFNEDYAGTLARYVPGAQFRRVVFGFATWRSPAGRRGNVAVVGMDGSGLPDNGFAADRSDLARLDLSEADPTRLQLGSISDTTLHLAATVDTLPTFLGAPYVIVPFERARELLGMDPSSTSFLVGDFAGTHPDFATTRLKAGREFPEVSLLSAREFADSSARYWQRKTGAGMAILLAAVLAALLMAILLSNGVLRFIQRYHQDLVSLLGHGASQREITAIVAIVASLIAVVTMTTALLATPVMIALFQPLLPWVTFRLSDALVPALAVVGALGIALLSARRAIADFAPDVVFRS